MSTAAIEALNQKRDDLIAEQMRIYQNFEKEIKQLESAMETLAGKKVWEFPRSEWFDDENPNYIKSSIEEI